MDVILLQDVEKLGMRGDVVGVARGYARNFLLPRRLAEVASPAKVAELERREARRARHEASTVEQAEAVKKQLEAMELRFDVAAGPTGTLFGSVTATDVADELWGSKKIRVDRRKIDLHEPIKRVGRYEVSIEVFSGVVAEVPTIVVPQGGELPTETEVEPESPVRDSGPAEGVPGEPEGPPAQTDAQETPSPQPEPEPEPAWDPDSVVWDPERAEPAEELPDTAPDR
jgi:large subunit ribosomal protein L9